jgi:hypothetical protein
LEQTLAYLRESLSNWTDNYALARVISTKLDSAPYQSEEAFVKDLSDDESVFLNDILQREMSHSRSEGDDIRLEELNNVYENLI